MGWIGTGPGSPLAFSSASGGKVYAYNVINEALVTLVAPANPSRQKIVFHNPGTTDVFIYPQYVIVGGSQVALNPSNATLGGCWRVYGNGGTLTVEGECQFAWFAFALTGGGAAAPLTVMDSNV